jgi:SAM-dependent methyltransferase
MERSVYDNMRAIEGQHWWFQARREILSDQLAQLRLPPHARLLEVGCGTGGNLAMLKRFGEVTAIEPDEPSREYAEQASGVRVLGGGLPDGLPRFDAPFDLVAALDVIEHLDEDAASVASLRGLLRDDGILFTTVPAHPWMWSRHDELHHHKRRYEKDQYVRMIEAAGFRILKASYFNTVLYPVIAAMRLAKAGERSGRADDALPSPLVNSLLKSAFKAEKLPLRHMDLPVGVSLLVIAQRTVN